METMRRLVILIVAIFTLCTISDSLVKAAEEDIREILLQDVTCNEDDGKCDSTIAATIAKIISYNKDDRSLTINTHLKYKEPFGKYGYEASVYLRDIVKNVNSLESLADDDSKYYNFVETMTVLAANMSGLMMLIKDELDSGHPRGTWARYFNTSHNICNAMLRLFNLLRSDYTVIKLDGIATAAQIASDLFQLRPLMDPSATLEDDYSTAYQYMTIAEDSVLQSLSSLGVDRKGNIIDSNDESNYRQQIDEAEVQSQLSAHFSISVRFGSLLLNMFLSGFSLDLQENLHFDPLAYNGVGNGELSITQKHILDQAFDKLETSTIVYRNMQKYQHDSFGLDESQRDLADAYSRMGAIKSLLLEWHLSAEYCQTGLAMYEELIQGDRGITEDINGCLTGSEYLFTAFLNLPGKTEYAKVAFQKYLLVLQAQAEETGDLRNIFRQELQNRDEEVVRQELLHLNEPPTQPVEGLEEVKQTLKTYQNMLGELLQQQQENRYSELDIDGGATYNFHDNFYEGSLRSVIGTFYYDLNQPWQARDELEQATRLLGEGIALVDSGQFEVVGDDGKPVAYSPRLDLAHVFLSLSYTYILLMQWEKSYDSFEQAMNIYQSELSEGESPMQVKSAANQKENSSPSMTDRVLKYFFRETEESSIELKDFQFGGQNETEV